jgi:molybdopterin converting factor small subunit
VAVVRLLGELAGCAGGLDELTIDAPRVVDLRAALVARFPDLGERLDQMAVAVDGEIFNEADYLPLQASTEVCFVPRVAGG